MSNVIKTNERCYICDFTNVMDDEIQATLMDKGIYSNVYNNSATGSTKRYVFVDSRDGRPVCTVCARRRHGIIVGRGVSKAEMRKIIDDHKEDIERILRQKKQAGHKDCLS